MAIDERKAEEAVGKVFGELGVAVTGPLEDDFSNPYARVGYAISTMVCTPSSLAQPGAAALGAMAGEARIR
jgi:hypothetical protein